jgi:hypothetical protein
MWWNKKRKLQRLCDELKSIALRDRLSSNTGAAEDERHARQLRQSELLAEIEQLTSKQPWRPLEKVMAASSRHAVSGQTAGRQSPAGPNKSAEQLKRGLDEHQHRIAPDPESPAAAA